MIQSEDEAYSQFHACFVWIFCLLSPAPFLIHTSEEVQHLVQSQEGELQNSYLNVQLWFPYPIFIWVLLFLRQ